INPAPSITTTSPLAAGTANAAYSQTLAATGGSGSYTWSITFGTLPAGLTLSSGGVISGTPTAVGTSNFTVLVTDSVSQTASKPFALTINSALSISTTSPLPTGTANVAYSQQLTTSGGTGALTWSLTFGTLPAGLTLTNGGRTSCRATASRP